MPTIDLTDEEHAAVTAAIRRAVEDDKFPHAPRLDPLRSPLAKFAAPEQPPSKAPPPARGKKRPSSVKLKALAACAEDLAGRTKSQLRDSRKRAITPGPFRS
jgi:hypothetical protein